MRAQFYSKRRLGIIFAGLMIGMPYQIAAVPSLQDVLTHLKAFMGVKTGQIFVAPKVRIACLAIEGKIVDSTKLVKVFYALRNDSSIDAVFIKVNSGGGSGGPAEIIFNEILRLKKEKPVIVMIENMCCSAAYLIASAATFIVAPALSEVGSIGVYYHILKHKTHKFKDGGHSGEASVEILAAGKYKASTDPDAPEMTPEQRAHELATLDSLYVSFRTAVAGARGLDLAHYEEWAEGKAFAGTRALELGLIDAIGSYSDAIEVALRCVKERSGREGEPEFVEINPA